jgi:hypothetical protein
MGPMGPMGAPGNPGQAGPPGLLENFTSSISFDGVGNIVDILIPTPITVPNASIVLNTRGDGALILDRTVHRPGEEKGVTGATRGINAVDFQVNRSVPTEVASGDHSVLLGTTSSRASGDRSIAIGAINSSVAGHESVLLGCSDSRITGNRSVNIASLNSLVEGNNSFIGGGVNDILTGYSSAILSGANCQNAGDTSVVLGGTLSSIGAGAAGSITLGGFGLKTTRSYQVALGQYNDPITGRVLFIGNGTNAAPSNVLSVDRTTGTIHSLSGSLVTSNADIAEYFQSEDGTRIPLGTPVTINSAGFIRPTFSREDPHGVISNTASTIGRAAEDEWHGKYLRNDYDDLLRDADNNLLLSSDYDATRPYLARSARPEWHVVGLLGVVKVLNGSPIGNRWVRMGPANATMFRCLIR